MTIEQIEQLYTKISDSIFTVKPQLAYDDLAPAFIELCNLINAREYDETLWHIGEYSHATLDALIVGAYWHYTEWHNGQYSQSYEALCALGSIFRPGMLRGPEPDSAELDVYNMLEELARPLLEGVE